MKKGWHKLARYLGYSVAAFIILAAFAVSVTRLLSPALDDDRQRFEKILEDILQRPVAIEHVHITWDYLQPTLSLTNVILFDPIKKRTILHVDQFKISPALFRSLFAWHLIPKDITITGIKLSIQQKDNGYIVNGEPLDASTGTSSWMFAHPDFLLKDVDLRFTTRDGHVYATQLRKLNLNASWKGNGGEFDLKGRDVSVTLNHIFSDPLMLETVQGTFQFKQLENHDWQVSVKNLETTNEDASAHVDMTMLLPEKDTASIDLSGKFKLMNAVRVTRYLPVKIFDDDLTHWLQDAFLSGGADAGEIRLHGRLMDFPFDKGGGTFLIQAHVHDLDLHVADGWPTLSKLTGDLIFSGDGMNANIQSGEVMDASLHDITATIPSLSADKVMLQVKGKAEGTLSEALQFIRHSPLKQKLGEYFKLLDPSGPMQVNLEMTMPLQSPSDVHLLGKMELANALFDLSRWHITFDRLTGNVSFSENGVSSAHLSGMFFDKPLLLTLQRKTDKDLAQVSLQSQISVSALESLLHISLQKYLQGEAPLSVQFALPDTPAQFQLNMQTDLSGVEVNVPGWYQKNKTDTLNTQIQLNVVPDSGVTSTEVVVDVPAQKSFLSGKTTIKLSTIEEDYKVDVDSDNIKGSVIVPIDDLSNGVHAQLKYLHLFSEQNTTQQLDPRILPPIDFAASDVHYGDLSLGAVSFTLLPRNNGVQIRELNVSAPFGRLRAAGNWLVTQNDLKGDLTTGDTDKLLTTFGSQVPNFEAGDGSVHFQLTWPGAPWQIALAKLSGDIAVTVHKGHIINLDSATNAQVGFARMLNIFSLQSIPQRVMSLDFSDLGGKGYSFDTLKGSFNLRMGDAFTRDTQFKSIIADIGAKGRIGFVTKDFDLRLSITPHVTSSLPTVAAIALNPLAGVAAWLVEKAVSPEVSKIVTYRYTITGPWDHPNWAKSENVADIDNFLNYKSLHWGGRIAS